MTESAPMRHGTASGGTNATGGEAAGGVPCTGSLEAVAAGRLYTCPPDYAAAEQWPITCSSWGVARLGSCGGLLAFTISNGMGGQECYYDSGTRAPVGAISVDDVRSFCENQEWTCVTDGPACNDTAAAYCSCNHVTFGDGATCPRVPYEHRGSCEQTTNCDPRDVTCDTATPACGTGQVPRVVAGCYDGSCVSIQQCQCTTAEECPERSQYTCLVDGSHCDFYLPN